MTAQAHGVTLHATAIAINGRGVLLTGPPGCGKSDLALRLIDGVGAALIADDMVRITCEGGRLLAFPPDESPPRMEVRGIGIVTIERVARAVPMALVVVLGATHSREARLDASEPICGLRLPRIALNPWEISVPVKLMLALDRWGH